MASDLVEAFRKTESTEAVAGASLDQTTLSAFLGSHAQQPLVAAPSVGGLAKDHSESSLVAASAVTMRLLVVSALRHVSDEPIIVLTIMKYANRD